MQDNKQNDFCSSGTEDTVEFNKLDYMLLFKALDSIRVTAKEYLEDRISKIDAHSKIMNEYKFYKCHTKRNIQENRSNKTVLLSVFGVLVYVIMLVFNYIVIKQLYNYRNGGISVIYAIIVLTLINPFYSFLTITYDLITYTTSNSIDIKKKEDIEDIEKKIQDALSCKPEQFSKEKVCTFYQYFDSQITEEKLCKCDLVSCKKDNELLTDRLTTKMEKLDSIYQFFENQKDFLLKSKNPFLQIKSNEKLDNVINFCLGENVENIVRENLNSDDKKSNLIGEDSQLIRNNASKILRDLESYAYEELGSFETYNKYFIDDINELYYKLTTNVLHFLSKDNNTAVFFKDNKLIKFDNISIFNESDYKLLFRCDNFKGRKYLDTYSISSDEGTKDSIMKLMLQIQIRLRRLNRLWLPEYNNFRTFLYSKNSNIDINIQKALYRSSTIEDLKPLFSEIIAIVMNNSNLIDTQNVYVPIDSDDSAITQCSEKNIDSIESYVEKTHVRPKNIDIKSYLPADILVQTTMLIPKINEFIRNLKYNFLDPNFMINYKIETSILKSIFDYNLDDIIKHEKKVLNYIVYYVKERHGLFMLEAKSEDRAKKMEIIFIKNLTTIFKHIIKKKEQEDKNSKLYFNASKEIEFPNKYISFNEFELKLQQIERKQYGEYMQNVENAKDDVVYFIDKIDDINNKLEKKHEMTFFYSKYLVIYFIISFTILFNIIWTEWYGISFDTYLIDKLHNMKISGIKDNVKSKFETMRNKVKTNFTRNDNRVTNTDMESVVENVKQNMEPVTQSIKDDNIVSHALNDSDNGRYDYIKANLSNAKQQASAQLSNTNQIVKTGISNAKQVAQTQLANAKSKLNNIKSIMKSRKKR